MYDTQVDLVVLKIGGSFSSVDGDLASVCVVIEVFCAIEWQAEKARLCWRILAAWIRR